MVRMCYVGYKSREQKFKVYNTWVVENCIQQLQQLQITQQWVTTYNTRVTYRPLYWSEMRTIMSVKVAGAG
jgi:hypothetical protein